MEAVNELIATVLGDSVGLLWGSIGLFLVVLVRIAESTTDVKTSSRAQDAIDLLKALGSLVAALAAVSIAWYAFGSDAGMKGVLFECAPLGLIVVALGFFLWVYWVSRPKRGSKKAAKSLQSSGDLSRGKDASVKVRS